MKKFRVIWFLIHLILGLYFINLAAKFIALPEFSADVNNIFFFVGGIFIIIGGVLHLRNKKKEKGFDIQDLIGKRK